MVHEVDLVVEAIEPIVVQRTYVSGNGRGEWTLFPHLILKLVPGGSHEKKYIRVAEPSGTMVTYRFSDDDHHVYKLSVHKHGKGATNTAQGVISGRTNLKNTTLFREKEKVRMHCANGTVRTYKETKSRLYLLEKEKLPSGRWILYKYNDDRELESVRTTNPLKTVEYARITFDYKSGGKDFSISASDGRKVFYEGGRYPKKISSPEKPSERVEYKLTPQIEVFVKERNFHKERKIQVDYYAHNEGDIKTLEDPRRNRVKTLYETVGNEIIPTYRFVYDISREEIKKGKYIYTENGKTDVFDVDNNLTRIHFSSQFYITEIERFENSNGKQKLHSKLNFTWENHGHLKSKTLLDATGNPVWEKHFAYDPNGNVKVETFSGDLKGNGGWESYAINYTYDQNNLVRSKQEDNGRITYYDYLPGTDLLTARFVADKDKIHSRELRFYDQDHLLITLILDDGSSKDPHNLQDVTERRVTHYEPNKRGIPQWIKEFYLEDGALKLLCKTLVLYKKENTFGHKIGYKVNRKEIYDSRDKLSSTWEYDYDYTEMNSKVGVLAMPALVHQK